MASDYNIQPLRIVFRASDHYHDCETADTTGRYQLLVWPTDFANSTCKVSRLPSIYEKLFQALRSKKHDEVISILTGDLITLKPGQSNGVFDLERESCTVNKELGPEAVTILDSANLIIALLLDAQSDPTMKIRQSLLYQSLRIRQENLAEEEESSQMESVNVQSLGGEVLDDLQEHECDQVQPSDEEFKNLCTETNEPVKPPYFPAQEFMGDRIVDRIVVILQHYHGKDLKHFTKFYPQIYTANSVMLEQQTVKRLCEKLAGCFPAKMFAKSAAAVIREGQKRVKKYTLSEDVKQRHKELLAMAENEPDTLILIVADEAHWGITGGDTKEIVNKTKRKTDGNKMKNDLGGDEDTEAMSDETNPGGEKTGGKKVDKETANDLLVNSWQDGKHPNVIVLQVSATPFNLLTDCSRIPNDKLYAKNRHTTEHMMIDPTSGKRSFAEGKDVTADIGTVCNLHHVKWSESFEAKLQAGVVTKLKVGHPKGEGFAWMCVGDPEGAYHPLNGTEDSEEADELTLKGESGKVCITALDGTLRLGTIEKRFRFMDTDRVQEKSPGFCTDFILHSRFGQDILEMQCGESYLTYDATKKAFVHGRAPPTEKVASFEISALSYAIQIDSLYFADESEPGKEYISLNYYYNTIRNPEKSEQLLRTDHQFTKRCTKLKTECSLIDDILAAEYSFYILVAKCLQDMQRKFQECGQNPKPKEFRTISMEYSQELRRKLKEFQVLLEEEQGEAKNFKPIKPGVFETVYKSLRAQALDSFQKEAKKMSRTNDHKLRSSLLFVSAHGVEPYSSDVATTMQWNQACKLMQNSECDLSILEAMVEHLRVESETFAIIQDLITAKTDKNGLHGHLKILRLSQGREKSEQAASGNRIYATLCLVRKVASQDREYLFEILRDYDNFKLRDQMKNVDDPDESKAVGRIRRVLQPMNCQHCDPKTHESCQCGDYSPLLPSLRCGKCSHLHKQITEYSDLDRLPCILILDRKGRMGDTFPPSFNVMDLRLNFVKTSSLVFLSSIMQDLGRMCRYSLKDGPVALPYALIGPQLEKVFKETLHESGVFFGSVRHPKCRVDRYVNNGKPAKDNFDRGNTQKHHNRILLEAEPQIGKTGVFLNVISKLRKRIEGDDGEQEEISYESDSEDEEVDGSEERVAPQLLDSSEWQYPHWKMMRDSSLPRRVDISKYGPVYGIYRHGKKPQALFKQKVPVTNAKHRPPDIGFDESMYRAFSAKRHRCFKCSRDTGAANHTITVAEEEVQISIPHSRRFRPVFDKLGIAPNRFTLSENSMLISSSQANRSSSVADKQQQQRQKQLNSWIFMPTYRRVEIGNINLAHTMVDMESGDTVDFVHVLVVRSEEFRAYAECWQSTHAILALPNTLQSPNENCEANVNEGGIGFARLFIQLFAQQFDLAWIFMVDDNVSLLNEVVGVRERNIIRDGNRNVQLRNVSMFHVLRDMESQMEHCDTAPKSKGEFATCPTEFCEENSCARHKYTGSPEQYAVLGMMKARPTVKKIVKPFKRTHVYSLVLLNIDALKCQNILYRPWVVHEDLNINDDADKRGLWVCKYNKFVMAKTQLKTWMAQVFMWQEDTSLCTMKQRGDSMDDWTDPLIQWIRTHAPPKRLAQLAADVQTDAPGILDEQMDVLREKVQQIRYGSHLCILVKEPNPEVSLQKFYSSTQGIGGFQKHAIFLPVSLCLQAKLHTRTDFCERVVRHCFREAEFHIITSHNIGFFRVPVLLLYVEGQALDTLDDRAIGNIERRRIHLPQPTGAVQEHHTDRQHGDMGDLGFPKEEIAERNTGDKGDLMIPGTTPDENGGEQEVAMEFEEDEGAVSGSVASPSAAEEQALLSAKMVADTGHGTQTTASAAAVEKDESVIMVESQSQSANTERTPHEHHTAEDDEPRTVGSPCSTADADWCCDDPNYIPDQELYDFVVTFDHVVESELAKLRSSCLPALTHQSAGRETSPGHESDVTSTDSDVSDSLLSGIITQGLTPDVTTSRTAEEITGSIGSNPRAFQVDPGTVTSEEENGADSDAKSDSLIPTSLPHLQEPYVTYVISDEDEDEPYVISDEDEDMLNTSTGVSPGRNIGVSPDHVGDEGRDTPPNPLRPRESVKRKNQNMPVEPAKRPSTGNVLRCAASHRVPSVSNLDGELARVSSSGTSAAGVKGWGRPDSTISRGSADIIIPMQTGEHKLTPRGASNILRPFECPTSHAADDQIPGGSLSHIDASQFRLVNQRSGKSKELKRGQTVLSTDLIDLGEANAERWLGKEEMSETLSHFKMKMPN